jgi:hypothetical protein
VFTALTTTVVYLSNCTVQSSRLLPLSTLHTGKHRTLQFVAKFFNGRVPAPHPDKGRAEAAEFGAIVKAKVRTTVKAKALGGISGLVELPVACSGLAQVRRGAIHNTQTNTASAYLLSASHSLILAVLQSCQDKCLF